MSSNTANNANTVIKDSQKFRENVVSKFSNIIGDETAATNMERGVFNYSLQEATKKRIIKKWENQPFLNLYVDRLRSVYMNLKNPTLLENIKSGEILPQNIAFMTHQEMKPTRWVDLIDQKIKRDANKYNNNLQSSTDMFTCKKCRGKRCTYFELQTRSADEPATIFVNCLDCGKNWRV